MKKIGLIILTALLALNGFAQEESRTERKAAREAEKAERQKEIQIEADAKARMVDSLISKRSFLMTADYLGDSRGSRVVVDAKVNFIIIDSTNVIIQTGSMGPGFGYNGLGGLTTDGEITRYEVARTGKNKDSYTLTVMVMTTIGMFDISMNVSPYGNATATITSNSGGRIIYYGDLAPVKGARIYKGSII